jgi:tetratricopeptide (TPR) repeat protein
MGMKSKPLVSEKAIARMVQGATVHWQQGEYDRYFETMSRVGQMDPRNQQIPLDTGTAHLMRYDYAAAEQSFERAINAAADKPATLEIIAVQCRNLNRYDMAERYLERAVAQKGSTPDTITKLAEMYERFRQTEKAWEMVDRALAANPANPLTLLVRARLERSAGRLEEGEKTLRLFLDRTDKDSTSTRIRGWYELGANLDRQGRYDEAMSAFLSAKALIRPLAGQAMELQRQVHFRLKQASETISRETLKRWAEQTQDKATSGFRLAVICGHPRSGTTLLEQLLDSHPGVVSAEETAIFYETYLEFRRAVNHSDGMLETLETATPAKLRRTRDWYLRSMQAFVGSKIDGRLLIDKNPSMTGLLPALARVFPAARVVVAIRDPRDVVLSCFMQPLPLNATSAFYLSLEDTATEYESLMGFYHAMKPRLPNPAMEVRYEDLVKDVESTSRVVLTFIGLDWDPNVLRFDEHAGKKLVRSPTYADVTRPISTSAVGRWKNYRKFIEPCLPKLQALLSAFGYE